MHVDSIKALSKVLKSSRMAELGAWRNWYTRTVQNRIPQGLGVRVSPHPQQLPKRIAVPQLRHMNYQNPNELEKYAFIWSEVKLLVAALALIIGGYPPIYLLLPMSATYGIVSLGLKLAWIISGVAAGYLAYRWYTGGQKLFGGKDMKDAVAFGVLVVSGINLGVTGILGQNIGMSISSNHVIFIAVAILYLLSAGYLFQRWNAHGKSIF
jgi:hypothetical protein